MYRILGIMFLSAMIYMIVPASKSEARITCTPPDFWGNQTCTNDSGGSVTQKPKDVFGNDVYQDNRTGRQIKCKKDFFGNYVCD
jgi:hypothetical protein